MPRVFQKRGHWWMDYRDARGGRVRCPALGLDGRRLKSKVSAEHALRDRLVDVQGEKRDPWRLSGDGTEPLAAFLDAHERDHVAHLAERTSRTRRLRYWREHFGAGAQLRDVRRASIERYVAQRLKAGLKPATVQRELAALSKAMSSAVQHGLVPSNPCKGVSLPRFDNRRTRYLSEDEEARFLEAVGAGPAWLRQVVLIALDAGARWGECRGVKPADVDMRTGILTFPHTKAGRIRHVPMTPRLRAAIGTLHPVPNDPRASFHLARDRAGLGTDVTFHTLRHTFATRLAAAGCPITVLQRLLGHSTIVMTERYAHVSDDAIRQAIALRVPSEKAPTRHHREKRAPRRAPAKPRK